MDRSGGRILFRVEGVEDNTLGERGKFRGAYLSFEGVAR